MVVTTTKGNDGRAARRQLLRRIGLVLGIFGVCLSLLVLLGVGGRQRRRRRFAFLDMGFRSPHEPQHPFQLDTAPLITNEKQVEEMILSAQLHLVDLEVDYEELAYSPSETYAGIYGRFCPLNFAAHKKNPTEGNRNETMALLCFDARIIMSAALEITIDLVVIDLCRFVVVPPHCFLAFIASLSCTRTTHHSLSSSKSPHVSRSGCCVT